MRPETVYAWHKLDAAGERIEVSFEWWPDPDGELGRLYFVKRFGPKTLMGRVPLVGARGITHQDGFTVETRG